METKDLASWVLGVHGTLFTISLYLSHRYSDRTQLFERTVGDMDSVLARMRQLIRGVLEEKLSPVFERSGAEPTVVVSPAVTYSETAQNPVGTEAFREALGAFLQDKCEFVAHYLEMLRARQRWASGARAMSWIALSLLIWEILCVTYFGLFGKLFGQEVPRWVMEWSFVPTGGLVVAFLLCWVICLVQHDRIHDHKTRYPNL